MISGSINNLISNLRNREAEISEDRKNVLKKFADSVIQMLEDRNKADIIFICTHNSRRSHMSQIWAHTISEYYNLKNIYCYSGGTEATKFNSNAVKAVKKSGFQITKEGESANPIYSLQYSSESEPIKCFSKIYNDEFNPQNNFIAVMTCSHADENCPVVSGAAGRISIHYEDPKKFDGTGLEDKKYSERFEEIGIEMTYAFGIIKQNQAKQ